MNWCKDDASVLILGATTLPDPSSLCNGSLTMGNTHSILLHSKLSNVIQFVRLRSFATSVFIIMASPYRATADHDDLT